MSLRQYAGSFAFIRNNQLRHWYGIALVGTAATMIAVGKGLEAVSDNMRMWLMDRVALSLDESSFGWLVEGLEVTVEGLLWLLMVWLLSLIHI